MIRGTQTTKELKPRVFESGLTPAFLGLLGLNACFAGWLTLQGFLINETWPGRGDMFLLAALAVLIGGVGIAVSTRGRKVTITQRAFEYETSKGKVCVPWRYCRTFVPTYGGPVWRRNVVVGDDKNNVAIDAMYFKNYAELVVLIKENRDRNKDVPEQFRRVKGA